jgi:superfamily II DNA or RNA helicase
METEISSRGYSILLKTLPTHFLEEIRNELYVKPIENPNYQSNVNAYPVFRISKSKVYIPRYYGIEKYGFPLKNNLSENNKIDISFSGTLRPVQEKTIEETLKIYSEYGGGLVSLDTGLGKTIVALKLISLMKQKTLILVHAEFLLEQWIERIKTFLPTARIGIIRQDRCEFQDTDICVGMIQSIVKRDDYPPDFFTSFGHMIADETHHIASKTFSSIFYKIQTKYMLGLSATPERKDGLSKVIYWFLGPQIVNIKRESDNPTIQFVFNTFYGEEKFNSLGKVNNPTMITDLTLNDERNKIIIKLILELIKNSRKILVLSDRRSHCENLKKELHLLNIDSGVYLGGMKTESRNNSVNCSVIIGTYQASGEGFDVPDLDTLILATPKSDVQQAVGRILRQKNANYPLVLDIVDEFSIFKGQYFKRKKFYKKNNFKLF